MQSFIDRGIPVRNGYYQFTFAANRKPLTGSSRYWAELHRYLTALTVSMPVENVIIGKGRDFYLTVSPCDPEVRLATVQAFLDVLVTAGLHDPKQGIVDRSAEPHPLEQPTTDTTES